jgi:hypothetical protein
MLDKEPVNEPYSTTLIPILLNLQNHNLVLCRYHVAFLNIAGA